MGQWHSFHWWRSRASATWLFHSNLFLGIIQHCAHWGVTPGFESLLPLPKRSETRCGWVDLESSTWGPVRLTDLRTGKILSPPTNGARIPDNLPQQECGFLYFLCSLKKKLQLTHTNFPWMTSLLWVRVLICKKWNNYIRSVWNVWHGGK